MVYPALLVGLIDGSIAVRSSVLNLLFIIPSNICNTQTTWGLQPLGQVCNEMDTITITLH